MNKKSKSLIIAGSVFTISTTIGQVISISELWIVFLVAVPNTLAWSYVLYIHVRNRYVGISQEQLNTVSNLLPQDNTIVHKHVDTLPELMNIWQQDEIEYKEANVDFNLLRDWWEKNNKGLFIRTKGAKIQGSIGIWAISETFFNDILNYSKTDAQLKARDIISNKDEDGCVYWYISGWFLRTNEDILHDFLGNAFDSLLKRLPTYQGSINISIVPMTSLETVLLERLDFKKVGSSRQNRHPVYCYTKPSLEHLKSITSIFLQSQDGIEAFENTERRNY